MKRIRLFTFPYAGGNAAAYMKWKKHLDTSIDLIPVELPGRGEKMHQPLYASMQEAVNGIYEQLESRFDEMPYALYGHSLGSYLAYELSRKLSGTRHNQPIHLFVSGRSAPCCSTELPVLHNLPDDRFRDEILKLGGTPVELFDNKQLHDLFVPVLRSDLKLAETYAYQENGEKLRCGITVCYGRNDDLTRSGMAEWRELTDSGSSTYEFEGGHFFIHDYAPEMAGIINRTLLDWRWENESRG